ncbi:hypothetical protein NAEGRDRAFT_57793 [Naegleria gruberi]|uniref:Uncharacterized protein n=1 Tax=Naegleria gruberi TaxID=5762 RepID=D2VCF3_NAEGR|nr:uncharacterized protein NAEGRDRAFT_57793 [Naegleria gruberi]EFC45296.1 hypothetical protein NAEGRDRAFT_57793 [Naegleria gruberi]|eukprot:XP_002678040.1 hypothetical protein NAEGRDRAFT_57793 [Naegleria gruberi strain NEG-M]
MSPKNFILACCLLFILLTSSTLLISPTQSKESPSSDFELLVKQLVIQKKQLGDKWNPKKFIPTRVRKIMKKLAISLPEKCARRENQVSDILIEQIRDLSKCFSEKKKCPKLNYELTCKCGQERIRKTKLVNGLNCPYFECRKKDQPTVKCPLIFTQDQKCKEGYYQVVKKVKFGKLDCDRKVCVKKVEKCPEISVNCAAGETRQASRDEKGCPVVTCTKLTCPPEFTDKTKVKCRDGWTLSEQQVNYQSITCNMLKCVKTPCPRELRETRSIKCKVGQRVVRKVVTINGRECGKYECEDIVCPQESKPQCADGQVAREISVWYHGKKCNAFRCMHDQCPTVETKECNPETEQVKVLTFKTDSGLTCYRQECEKKKKTCKNVCVNYSQRAGKCVRYEMKGEQQRCIKWSWTGSNNCIEEKIVNQCVRYVQGGQTCTNKKVVTSCAREGSRQECTKYGEKEVCAERADKAVCERYSTRVVGCNKYNEVTSCAQWNSIPKTKCKAVKYCVKELPSRTEKYCTAYKKQCQKGKREVCTTTTCPCNKKPVTKCRTYYFDGCCESKCQSWATRTVPGKCTAYGYKQECTPNGSERVCAKYKSTKECVSPRTEKICTRWTKTSSEVCSKKEKISVCLSSKYTKYCAETTQKEVCESWAVTNARCAEYKQSKVCIRKSEGQKICQQYQSFGGEQVCVEKSKEDVCAEYKQMCTYE